VNHLSKDNVSRGSFSELLTQRVKSSGEAKVNSATKLHAFTWQQVEIAVRWARDEPYSKIRSSLGIKHDSQISQSLNKFKPTAKLMLEAVRKLSHGYYKKILRESAESRLYTMKATESAKQMLREGRWPYARRLLLYGYDIVGEKREIRLNLKYKEKLAEYIRRCADGEVPFTVAKELGIPRNRVYRILDHPIYKGYMSVGGELVPHKHLAVVDEKIWDRAHALFISMKKMKTKRSKPPLGVKWVGVDLAPHDPENKVSRLMQLRLKRFGLHSIAKELDVSVTALKTALKHLPLYVKLGMVDPETAKRVRQIKLPADEAAQRKRETTKTKILLVLAKGSGTAKEIGERAQLSRHAVADHLYRLKGKVVDKEPRFRGRWYLLESVKPKD